MNNNRDKKDFKKFYQPPHPNNLQRIQQRKKQIEFGKNTEGYKNYIQMIPFNRRTIEEPMTPDPESEISKRCFDRQLKEWRKKLHNYDNHIINNPNKKTVNKE